MNTLQTNTVKTYRARFTGREVGAIGTFQRFETDVEARNKDEANLALYNRFEHISNLELSLLGHESAPNKAQHSPLPWERYGMTIGNKDHPVLAGAFNSFDAEVGGRRITDAIEIEDDEALANARLIVRAVNHADKLAEALREWLDMNAIGHTPTPTALKDWRSALAAYEADK